MQNLANIFPDHKYKEPVLTMIARLAVALVCFAPPALAQEESRLIDGRTILLYEDGTYDFPEMNRAVDIALVSMGRATGFMSDARDCGLSFEVENNVGGRILGLNIDLEVLDLQGNSMLNDGITAYEIDIGGWSDDPLAAGARITQGVDVQADCTQISEIRIADVPDYFCNYVGREPEDICRDLMRPESRVSRVDFTK